MNSFLQILGLTLVALCCLQCSDQNQIDVTKPNIIFILADDLGIGDVSTFNSAGKITTPHIDSLADLGMRFTDAHSPSSVCSPTRYGILTGRYSWRSRLKSGVTWSWDQPLIRDDQTTVASLLKKKGYRTACVGKWHLGLGWQKDSTDTENITLPLSKGPNDLGFEYFFGITASLDIPPYIYIENDRSTTPQIDTIAKKDGKEFWRKGQIGSDFTHEDCLPTLTEKAVEFIRQQNNENPFFLYFPLPAPHTPILPTTKFKGKSNTNEYGDFVLMVDDVVGQIKQALRENNMEENTLVIFTSDNGCSPMADFAELAALDHQPSAAYRGHKADIYEGGHRVPFVASWPAVIPSGSTSTQTICLTDLMATCASIVQDTLADDEGVDSYNIYPLLRGNNEASIREATVSHSVNGSYAIRQGDWKLIFCPGSGGWSDPVPKEAIELRLPSLQLFDLKNDPGERANLVENEPKKVEELTQLMKKYIDEGRSTRGKAQQNDEATNLYFARDKLASVMAEQSKYLIHKK